MFFRIEQNSTRKGKSNHIHLFLFVRPIDRCTRSYQLIQRIVLRRYLSVVDPNGFPTAEFVSVCTTPVAPTAAAVARYTLGRSLSLPAYL